MLINVDLSQMYLMFFVIKFLDLILVVLGLTQKTYDIGVVGFISMVDYSPFAD